MSVELRPLSEVTEQATKTLIREIGVVDTIRFLNQFRTGSGDYTQERERFLEGRSVREVIREIKALRDAAPGAGESESA